MHHEFDHRVLGSKYDLFSFFEEGPGFPVWHDKGLKIKNALISLWRRAHEDQGYREIQSPILLDKELWRRSGHCDYFEQNMYFSSVDKRDYAIKPMSCPGAILLFNQKKRSHAELPLRLCELGHVHRNENSGSLHGLLRVRSFVQDDAHIFCSEEQLLPELRQILRLIQFLLKECGLVKYRFELSLRGEDSAGYLGSNENWRLAEAKLEEAVRELGSAVVKRPGEAKFYGPSLDLHLEDVHGRSWQCSTVQLDFNLPGRFQLHYFDAQGERRVPFMLHRAIFGSLERFIGILLENYGRDLPFWLHPVQYRVLSVVPEANPYAQEVAQELRRRGHSIELDLSDRPLKEKLRRAHEGMVHSVVLAGLKERDAGRIVAKELRSGVQKELR